MSVAVQQFPVTVQVQARPHWCDTGIRIQAGVRYTFTAAGDWSDWGRHCGPDGYASDTAIMRVAGRVCVGCRSRTGSRSAVHWTATAQRCFRLRLQCPSPIGGFDGDKGTMMIAAFVQRMRQLAVVAAITFFGLTASANANIFGEDTRHPQSREGAGRVYAPIMRLRLNNAVTIEPATYRDVVAGKAKVYSGGMATGFMVSPCYMLTNYHAVFGEIGNINNDEMKNFSVTVYTPNGEKLLARPEKTSKTDTGQNIDSSDWTFLRLDRCVGEEIGWMERGDARIADERHFDYYTAGFPGDIAKLDPKADLVISEKCALKSQVGMNNGEWDTDCPNMPGASGSPLFYKDQNGVPRYVGMLRSQRHGALTHYPRWTPDTTNSATGRVGGRLVKWDGLDWLEAWHRVDADQKRFGRPNPSLNGFPPEVFSDSQGQMPEQLLRAPKF